MPWPCFAAIARSFLTSKLNPGPGKPGPQSEIIMETIIITNEFAGKCADALIDKHNEIARRGVDSCTLISFCSLYIDLCKLGFSWKIATAIHPINEHNFPLFLNENGEPIK